MIFNWGSWLGGLSLSVCTVSEGNFLHFLFYFNVTATWRICCHGSHSQCEFQCPNDFQSYRLTPNFALTECKRWLSQERKKKKLCRSLSNKKVEMICKGYTLHLGRGPRCTIFFMGLQKHHQQWTKPFLQKEKNGNNMREKKF